MVMLEIEEKLKKIMTHEISLFSLYKDEFNKMVNLVMEKEWITLQRSFDAVQNISNEIEKADTKRDDLYCELCKLTGSNKDDSFYSVISKIHNNGSSEINDIYRIVKHETHSIKVLNDGFSRYIQSRKNLVNEIMEELVPDRKGTIYNRKGFSFHDGSSSSLILNKHL
jgi:hypothetical protein